MNVIQNVKTDIFLTVMGILGKQIFVMRRRMINIIHVRIILTVFIIALMIMMVKSDMNTVMFIVAQNLDLKTNLMLVLVTSLAK